jgi:hypothetical protein
MSYSTTLDADDGAPPYSWSAPGPLPVPAGLTLSSGGVLSGTPTVIGSFTIDVELTDASGATASGQVTITIHPELIVTAPVSLQAWTINRAYPAVTATATGGFGAYTWSASGLPAGMSIDSSTGVISGTPTQSGTFNNVGITVTDSASPPGTRTRTMTLTINPPPTVSPPSTCNVVKGSSVNFALSATSGTPGYTWSATSLPAWLALNGNRLQGTVPNSNGGPQDYVFSVRVTDSAGAMSAVTQFTVHAVNNNAGTPGCTN